MQKTLPISVCMISSAEARRIGRALESVASWAGEIIIVLNEDVTDGTDALAEKFGAKVFREPWKGFIAQKNSAAEKATRPWLLNIDADEVLSPELVEEIAAVVARRDGPHAAYEFPRCTLFHGRWIRHGDWYPDRVVRLWQRSAARWTGDDPHARLQVNGTIGRLQSDLLHHSMESLDHLLRKTAIYADDFVRRFEPQSRRVGWMELWARPAWRFFRAYVVRLGFLDGWQGYCIARLAAFYTFLRYAKLREASLSPRTNP